MRPPLPKQEFSEKILEGIRKLDREIMEVAESMANGKETPAMRRYLANLVMAQWIETDRFIKQIAY